MCYGNASARGGLGALPDGLLLAVACGQGRPGLRLEAGRVTRAHEQHHVQGLTPNRLLLFPMIEIIDSLLIVFSYRKALASILRTGGLISYRILLEQRPVSLQQISLIWM